VGRPLDLGHLHYFACAVGIWDNLALLTLDTRLDQDFECHLFGAGWIGTLNAHSGALLESGGVGQSV